VTAEFQNIAFGEFLPLLVGSKSVFPHGNGFTQERIRRVFILAEKLLIDLLTKNYVLCYFSPQLQTKNFQIFSGQILDLKGI
jgi:hypothetical protein